MSTAKQSQLSSSKVLLFFSNYYFTKKKKKYIKWKLVDKKIGSTWNFIHENEDRYGHTNTLANIRLIPLRRLQRISNISLVNDELFSLFVFVSEWVDGFMSSYACDLLPPSSY